MPSPDPRMSASSAWDSCESCEAGKNSGSRCDAGGGGEGVAGGGVGGGANGFGVGGAGVSANGFDSGGRDGGGIERSADVAQQIIYAAIPTRRAKCKRKAI